MNEPIGRARGGVARMNSMSPEARKEQAKQAAKARWSGDLPYAIYGSSDQPVRIGALEVPCYVLNNEQRVLTDRGLITALGMARGGAGSFSSGQGDRLERFLTGAVLKPYVSNDLLSAIRNPIPFRVKVHGAGMRRALGYDAEALPAICEAVLQARSEGVLHPRQFHIATRCELIARGLMRVGIIALVDEATGYQRDRAKDALASILEAFIAKELQPYVRTFPADYYEEIFRLRGLEYPSGSVKRPQYFGMLTNDIVYKRLAPGVLEELKRVTPKLESGRHKDKLFQRLTTNIGYPKLREHLGSIVTMMKLSRDWHDFKNKIDRLHPRYNETLPLPLDYKDEDDDGKGL
jgi:hypothetical protein